jgi:hypothetical protein
MCRTAQRAVLTSCFLLTRLGLLDIKTPVLAKVSKWLLVFLLSLTLGFHWGLLQSAAWVGMVVNYSCQGSLKDAMSKTFDGQHPCPLCKLVREGKKSEKKPEAQSDVKKIDLFTAQALVFNFPSRPVPSFPDLFLTISRIEAPLLPPPRSFFG